MIHVDSIGQDELGKEIGHEYFDENGKTLLKVMFNLPLDRGCKPSIKCAAYWSFRQNKNFGVLYSGSAHPQAGLDYSFFYRDTPPDSEAIKHFIANDVRYK